MIRNVRRQILALIIFAFAVTAVLENTAQAVEPYVEFVQGLRARKFYDYTLMYLDTLKDDPYVPAPGLYTHLTLLTPQHREN